MDDLRTVRERLGLSQLTLANAIEEEAAAVTTTERGDAVPSPELRAVLEHVLGEEIDWVLTYLGRRPGPDDSSEHAALAHLIRRYVSEGRGEAGRSSRLRWIRAVADTVETELGDDDATK